MVALPPISRKLAEEFFEAIREYVRWAFGHPKKPLPFDRYVQLSLVCDCPVRKALARPS
jgi:hypothetical protein